MNAPLAALMSAGFDTTVSSNPATFYVPLASTTRAQMNTAGLTTDFTPRELAIMVRLEDGTYREPHPVIAMSDVLVSGRREVIWPRKALSFRDRIADLDGNVRIVRALTWAEVADFELDVPNSAGSCACHDPSLGSCTYTGPALVSPGVGRNEYPVGTWSGTGCVQKPCGEVAGHPNWPFGVPR